MRLTFILILFMSYLGAVRAQYVVDAAHTSVEFKIPHFKVNTVKGTFNDVSGMLQYSENHADISVSIKILTSSIDTNNSGRDTHLKSADFFDAQKYPEILFVSKRISKDKDKFLAVGDLTMHGVTKEVAIPFTITKPFKDPLPRGISRLIVNATFELNRTDYGLTWSRVMETGELFVGNEVQIEINSEFYVPKEVKP
jgi:polyisoprenoid-binding protein YceI